MKQADDDSDTEAPPWSKRHADTHETVQKLVDQLKDKYSSQFTPMQYRTVYLGITNFWKIAQ